MFSLSNKQFLCWWLTAIGLFLVLGSMSLHFEIYRLFPAIGFIGYPLLLLFLLIALSASQQRWHYIARGRSHLIEQSTFNNSTDVR